MGAIVERGPIQAMYCQQKVDPDFVENVTKLVKLPNIGRFRCTGAISKCGPIYLTQYKLFNQILKLYVK